MIDLQPFDTYIFPNSRLRPLLLCLEPMAGSSVISTEWFPDLRAEVENSPLFSGRRHVFLEISGRYPVFEAGDSLAFERELLGVT